MELDRPLLKLPREYCAKTLSAEVSALPSSAWIAHPGKLAGNDAVPLITPDGLITNGFAGPMAPTEHLRRCPYIMEIMADLGAVWGRSRLMGLAPSADVPEHVDVGYYWRTHFRIHIPIVTSPRVSFTCDGESVHMAAGECWIFDSFRLHNVRNTGVDKRIHLVLDTVGGETLWDLMAEAKLTSDASAPVPTLTPGSTTVERLAYERINLPEIMSAWEVRCHVDYLVCQIPSERVRASAKALLERFTNSWAAAWAEYGSQEDGIPRYRKLIVSVRDDLKLCGADRILLPNRVPLYRALDELIFLVAVPIAR